MIELTEPQQRELDGTKPVLVRDPRTGRTYVLVPKPEYDRLLRLLDDDTTYTTAEMLDEVMAEDDAGDPHLAELQKKYGGTT
jgi:hypothetical protein